MSVLGRREIIRRLDDGSLVVSPILHHSQIGRCSIDLRMGNVLLMARARGSSSVDPAEASNRRAHSKKVRRANHAHERDQEQRLERFDIPFRSRFLLHPGALALVPTFEWLKLPDDLVGTVTARSTWARVGLSIATATLVEPTYEGIVTLELANLGQIPVVLYPGLLLSQIAFLDVNGETSGIGQSQFALSFEPKQGWITKESEEPFLPPVPRPPRQRRAGS